MAYPSVRSSSSGEGSGNGGGSSNVQVQMPPTISAGDTLLVVIAQDGTNLFDPGDSGFTMLAASQHSTGQVSLAVFVKKAAGDEDAAWRGFHGTASLQFAWVAYCFQDAADPTVTPPTVSNVAEGADTSVELPNCNPGSAKDYYWLGCAGCDYRAFTGYPASLELNNLSAGVSGTFNASAAGAGHQENATNKTPANSFTIGSSDQWLSRTVAIHPLGAVAQQVTFAAAVRTREAPAMTATANVHVVFEAAERVRIAPAMQSGINQQVVFPAAVRVRTAPPLTVTQQVATKLSAILIGEDPYPVRPSTFRLNDQLGARSTGHVTIVDLESSLDLQPGMPVEVWLQSTLLFAGYLAEGLAMVPVVATGAGRYWECDLIDHHFLADKVIVFGAWDDIPARDLVVELLDGWLDAEGVTFDYGSCPPGPTLYRQVFNYVPASQALSRIAELAGWWWHIGHDKALTMGPRDTNVAPWQLATGGCYWKTVKLAQGTLEYRNRQYLKGGRAETDPQVEVFAGDGERQTFTVGYPLAHVPTVEVDTGGGYTEATVGIRGIDTGMEWYWQKDSEQITQGTGSGSAPLGTTDLLRVTYVGSYPLIVLSENSEQVYLRGNIDGSTGQVEAVATDAAADSREAAFARAASLLDLYAQTGRTLSFRTRRGGLQPGQLLTVTLPAVGLAGAQLLIQRVQVTAPSSEWVEYTVEAVEGPATQTWAEWFAAARNPELGSSYEAAALVETVMLQEEWDEGWGWYYMEAGIPLACPVPSVDLYPSDSLYPC